MASGSNSAFKFNFRRHCVACGTFGLWTAWVWECDVCEDYFLCESCYKLSREDCAVVLSAPAQVHSPDHPMSPHMTPYICDGCESFPIWNHRWRCKVCLDVDLCEACYGELDAVDMPPGHSKEHPMIDVEVLCTEWHKFQPSFKKPVDPQWSYRVDVDLSRCGFVWVKRKSLAEISNISQMGEVEVGKITQAPPSTDENNGGHTSRVENQISLEHKGLAINEPSETAPMRRIFDERYKIFLSHAGADKDFVEQLFVDLSQVHRFGIFFDKDDGSLPKGEPFPERIFDAAKHCELAIVVISDDYFVRKWPMLELATFVTAQKAWPELKILPVFFKLSVEEFKQPKRRESYKKSWMQMPGITKDDVQLWNEALRVISRTNGIEYDKSKGEVAFREEIIQTVCKQVKPILMWDDSHVQGKARMQEMIEKMIQSSNNVTINMGKEAQPACTSYVGLYGMGGSGKSTFCKVLCNEMAQQYLGRVCHIEFGSIDTLELRKKLLRRISLLDSSLLMAIDEGEALHLLKHHFPKYKVCLMIDNVSDNQACIEEARTLLNLPFKEGSLILVTSRSSIILEKLKIKKSSLMRMPTISTHEAKALFCHHAGCNVWILSNDQKKAMQNFIERCNFEVYDDVVSREYHPLALKVLGTRVGPKPEEWDTIIIDFKYYENENKHHIFSILRTSYDALCPKFQRMFLDTALNMDNLYSRSTNDIHLRWQLRCLYNERDERFFSNMVKTLQAKSLIEFYDAEDGIYIHDLYREFASMEVEKIGLQHSSSCCVSRGCNGQQIVQKGRLRIRHERILHVTRDILSCKICSKAQLLKIEECPELRSIDILNMHNLKVFYVARGGDKLRSVNLEGAINLQCFVWYGFFTVEEPIARSQVLFLSVKENLFPPPPPPGGSLDLSGCSNLEILCLQQLPLNLFDLNQVVNLKNFHVNCCQYLKRFEGLEALVKLEDLQLHYCSSLLEFPSLANFPYLKIFKLEGAAKVKELQGFANLTCLENLSLRDGGRLRGLLGIEACTRLSSLDLSWTIMEDFSWISLMKHLTFINLCGIKIMCVPDCSDLGKLSEFLLGICGALESLGIHPTLLSSLKKMSAYSCQRLKAVQQFNSESGLKFLDIRRTSVEDIISGVMDCKYLQQLDCGKTCITSLPDLSKLTSLEVLDVQGCDLLTRMDNTKSLPALKSLVVDDCKSLLALPDLGRSKALTSLSMLNCPLLDPNSVKLPSAECTVDMEMENAADDQSDSDVEWHECEEQTPAVVCHEPVPAHSLWRSASYLIWGVVSIVMAWTLCRKVGNC